MYNKSDQIIWDRVFSDIPDEWTQVGPSESMLDCLEYFRNNNVRTALDLGCGIGIWALFLSKSKMKVKGLDFSRKAIDFAKKWSMKENQEIIFDCSPLVDHPFRNELFDGILAAKILDNIPSEQLTATKNQLDRNLSPNGILFGLFNPYMIADQLSQLNIGSNPTKGITSINFKDDELEQLFPHYELLEFKHYEYGFRGLVWQKPANIREGESKG